MQRRDPRLQEHLNQEIVLAVEMLDEEEVRDLLQKGADPNSVITGDTLSPLLWYSTYHNDIPITRLLLEAGANPNTENINNYGDSTTPLMNALSDGNDELVDILLENGADVDYKTPLDQESALMNAIINKNIDAINELIRLGANFDPGEDVSTIWNLMYQRNLIYDEETVQMVKDLISSVLREGIARVLPRVSQVAHTRGRKMELAEELSLLPRRPIIRRTQLVPSPISETVRSVRVKRGGRPRQLTYARIPTFPGGSQFLETEASFGGIPPAIRAPRARSPRQEMIRRRAQEARSPSRKRSPRRGRSL